MATRRGYLTRRGRFWPRTAWATPPSRWSRRATARWASSQPMSRRLIQSEAGPGSGVAVVEQVQAPSLLIGFADGVGRPRQRRHAPQEAPIWLMRIRHRAKALPTVAAQLVQ